jgi:hypothetical protein
VKTAYPIYQWWMTLRSPGGHIQSDAHVKQSIQRYSMVQCKRNSRSTCAKFGQNWFSTLMPGCSRVANITGTSLGRWLDHMLRSQNIPSWRSDLNDNSDIWVEWLPLRQHPAGPNGYFAGPGPGGYTLIWIDRHVYIELDSSMDMIMDNSRIWFVVIYVYLDWRSLSGYT